VDHLVRNVVEVWRHTGAQSGPHAVVQRTLQTITQRDPARLCGCVTRSIFLHADHADSEETKGLGCCQRRVAYREQACVKPTYSLVNLDAWASFLHILSGGAEVTVASLGRVDGCRGRGATEKGNRLAINLDVDGPDIWLIRSFVVSENLKGIQL